MASLQLLDHTIVNVHSLPKFYEYVQYTVLTSWEIFEKLPRIGIEYNILQVHTKYSSHGLVRIGGWLSIDKNIYESAIAVLNVKQTHSLVTWQRDQDWNRYNYITNYLHLEEQTTPHLHPFSVWSFPPFFKTCESNVTVPSSLCETACRVSLVLRTDCPSISSYQWY